MSETKVSLVSSATETYFPVEHWSYWLPYTLQLFIHAKTLSPVPVTWLIQYVLNKGNELQFLDVISATYYSLLLV